MYICICKQTLQNSFILALRVRQHFYFGYAALQTAAPMTFGYALTNAVSFKTRLATHNTASNQNHKVCTAYSQHQNDKTESICVLAMLPRTNS